MLNKKLYVFLFVVVFAVVSGTAIIWVKHRNDNDIYHLVANNKFDGLILKNPRVIKQFKLTADNGHAFTKDGLKGHWTFMFFGFTNCGYVCPTTMAALNKMYVILRSQLPDNLLPQIVMVSVDPDRDTAKRLHDYVTTFNKKFIGVRGDITQTKILAQQMSVVFDKVQMSNGDYSMNHSAELMLLDPNGNLQAFFSYPHQGKQMAQDYKSMLKM